MLNRRQFTQSLVTASIAAPWQQALYPLWLLLHSRVRRSLSSGQMSFSTPTRKHFLDRLAMGYAMGGQWHAPRLDLASVYIDQFNERDIGKQRLDRYHIQASPTIEDALTLGCSKLAVDGVVIIGEHGNYPKNELGNALSALRLVQKSGSRF